MASLGSFNPHDHDTENTDYPELPIGTYRFQVEKAEIDERDNGNKGLKLTYDVLEPVEYEGRKMFAYMNLEHDNPKAQEIGNKDLAKLCRAGEISVEGRDMETDDLLYKSFVADIGWGKASKTKNADGTPEYPARMEIKKWHFPDQGNVPTPEVKEAANDNHAPARPAARPAVASNSRPASAAPAKPAGAKPWSKSA